LIAFRPILDWLQTFSKNVLAPSQEEDAKGLKMSNETETLPRFCECLAIQHRFTPSKEPAPKKGDILHACGFTNWHCIVLKIHRRLPPNEDGTMDVKMKVKRWEIGKEERPCPVCGAAWMHTRPPEEENV
jgi:hypothetical protein